MEKLMLRPAEAATLIGFARTTIYKLIHSEQIPFCRVGKSIRIPVAALKDWAQEKGMEMAPGIERGATRAVRNQGVK